jgi:hypothetical protein
MEEHESHSTPSKRRAKTGWRPNKKVVFTTIILLIVAGAGFYFGTVYQKNVYKAEQDAAKVAATPNIGKVADISDKKISIKITKTNETKSYDINSNTQILVNGKKVGAGDIKKDQSVIILTEPGKPNVARRITASTPPTINNSSVKKN